MRGDRCPAQTVAHSDLNEGEPKKLGPRGGLDQDTVQPGPKSSGRDAPLTESEQQELTQHLPPVLPLPEDQQPVVAARRHAVATR